MECKNLCGKDLTGRQKEFCSDRCRMQHKRVKVEQDSKPEQPKPEQMKVEHKPEQQANFGHPDCDCKQCQANRSMSQWRLRI